MYLLLVENNPIEITTLYLAVTQKVVKMTAKTESNLFLSPCETCRHG